METVKIVFDVDSKDIKTTTEELKALNKVTNEEVAAMDRLSNAAEDAGDGFVSLRTQVKQAKEEAQRAAEKYGEFSKEANAARVKAGALADQMGDLNRQVSLLNPEAKAKAFSNLAQGVVGAFSIATGALQAFGVKNKEVEALAMKLQGALNITQGIASIGNLKESLEDVKVVLGFTNGATTTLTASQRAQAVAAAQAAAGNVTLTAAQEAEAIAAAEAAAAQKALNASLLSNPIFLVVAAIGALAAAYMTLNDEVKSAILNEEQLKEAKKKTVELKNKELQTSIDLRVANKEISKQEGERQKIEAKRLEDTKELSKQTKTLAEDQVKSDKKIIDLTKEAEQLRKDALKERDPELRKALLANSESAKAQVETEKKKNAQIKQSYTTLNEQLSAINKTAANEKQQQNISETEDKDAANKKQLSSDEAAAAKREQIRAKEAADREKAWQDEYKLIQLRQENQVDDAQTNEQKLALQQQFAVENYQYELNHLIETKATVTELQILWETYYAKRKQLASQQDKAIQDSCDAELKAEQDLLNKLKGLNDKSENDPIKKIEKETAAITEEYQKRLKAAQEHGNDTTKLTQEYNEFVRNQAQKTSEEQDKIRKKEKEQLDEDYKERLDKTKEIATGVFDSANFLGQLAFENRKRETDQELQNLEDQKNKKLITEEQYQAQLKVIKRKQAEDEKKQAIFNATIDLSRAIIAALTIPPPGSITAAAFAAALAGANLAKIIATPLPKYQKGTLAVPGIDMGRDSVHAMLQPGEAVIPVSTNRAYHPTIKAIYEKKISPSEINSFVMSRTSAGGKQSVTANVDTYALGRVLGKNKGVQIENAQAVGRVIARELSNHNIRRG